MAGSVDRLLPGEDAGRVRSKPAFAKFCGVAPIPTSSGVNTRQQLILSGHRQADAAL